MSVYLPKVNQLKNCENTNIIEILRYIAEKVMIFCVRVLCPVYACYKFFR